LKEAAEDKFIAMVSARAETDLRLSDFAPRSSLVVPAHDVRRAMYPAIDFHNHLDALDPERVLRVLDACNVERCVNITMRVGDEAVEVLERFRRAAPERFDTVAWMDWRDLGEPGFFERSVERLERLVERGARGLKVWKDLGLTLRDPEGSLLRVDDERLAPLFERAGQLGIFVMFHTADPDAFFQPIDSFNERYEELSAHPDWGFHNSHFTKGELLAQRNRVFARHPRTTFVGAHVAERPECLAEVAGWLEEYPNLYVDISARVSELGRQPYTAREFFLKHADRILFGTDLVPEEEMYRLYFRFLETADEYFDYPSHASRQGRWQIYGLRLPEEVLRRVYRDNALRLLGG
jgi:predicted TIM-barrel fold metal-dependent hydrolase